MRFRASVAVQCSSLRSSEPCELISHIMYNVNHIHRAMLALAAGGALEKQGVIEDSGGKEV